MFAARQPSKADIEGFISHSRGLPLSYSPIGIATAAQSRRGRVDELFVTIGQGTADFERARKAVAGWEHFDMPWVQVHPPQPSLEPGTDVAVLIRHFGFWSLNGARVVYTVGETDRQRRFGFAYGTLTNHGESGEELFEVLIDPQTGAVVYHLRAVSWPQSVLARIGYPLVRLLQARFRHDSGVAMQRAVAAG
jgi:uncharacterized protein (UPF0548 family)